MKANCIGLFTIVFMQFVSFMFTFLFFPCYEFVILRDGWGEGLDDGWGGWGWGWRCDGSCKFVSFSSCLLIPFFPCYELVIEVKGMVEVRGWTMVMIEDWGRENKSYDELVNVKISMGMKMIRMRMEVWWWGERCCCQWRFLTMRLDRD